MIADMMPEIPMSAAAAAGAIGSIGTAYMLSPSLNTAVGGGQVPGGNPQPGSPGGGASPNTNTPEGTVLYILAFFASVPHLLSS